jgi:hypothetical protein
MPTTSGQSQQPQLTIKPPIPRSRVQTPRGHLTTMPTKCTRGTQDYLVITIIDKKKEEKEKNTYFLA